MLLAPYLGYNAPTNRPNSGGWASADIPRFIGLLALRRLGITCCEALPVLAFAVPPNSEKNLAPAYSDRLMRNFATQDFRTDLAAATKPLTIFSGADDELMLADKYVEAVRGAARHQCEADRRRQPHGHRQPRRPLSLSPMTSRRERGPSGS